MLMLMPMQMLLLMLMQMRMLMQMLMPMLQNQWFGQAKGLVPSLQSYGPLGLCIPKKRDFGTSIPKRHNLTITNYLQYKTSVFMVPRPPKYQYFGTPKAAKQWCWCWQVTPAMSLPLCHSSYVTPADADANDSINQWFGQAPGVSTPLSVLLASGIM